MGIDLVNLWEVAPYLCLLIVCIIATVFVIRLFDKTKKHDADITEIKSEIKEIRVDVKTMASDIGDVKNNLSYLRGGFEMFKKGMSPVALSQSPISLTPVGIEKSKIINAEGMVARNWEKIYDNLEKNISNKNPYDIQQYCMDTAAVHPDKFLSDRDIDSLKMLAYADGYPLMYYSPIFGVLIRDKYLSIKGIDVSDVDKNDPSKTT